MSFLCQPLSLTDLQKKISNDNRAYQAGAFAGTGIPMLDLILKNLSNSVNSALGVGYTMGSTILQQTLQKQLAKWGITTTGASALAGLVTLLNIGAEGQIAFMSMLLSYFQTQVTLRYVLMQELSFHINGILDIIKGLNQYTNAGVTDMRVKAAYPSMVKALQDLQLLQNAVGSPRPMINPLLYNDALLKIQNAITILSAPPSTLAGQDLAYMVASKQKNALTKYIVDTVAQQQALYGQTYIWHLTNYVTILTGGIAPLGWSIADIQSANIKTNVNQLITQRQQEFEQLKLYVENKLALAPDAIQVIDANKGLLATHLIIKNMAIQIINFTVNWNYLTNSAKALWYSFTPSISILQSVVQQSSSYLQGDQKTLTLNTGFATPIFTTIWAISQLQAAQTNLQIITPSVSSYVGTQTNLLAFANLQNYLQSQTYETYTQYIDSLLSLATDLTWASISGPFSTRQLARAEVMFKQCKTYINAAIQNDSTILQLASEFSIIDDPAVQAVSSAFSGLAAQSPEAAALLSTAVTDTASLGSLLIGAYQSMIAAGTVAASVVSSAASMASAAIIGNSDNPPTLSSLIAKIFGNCPTAGSKTALTNSDIEKLNNTASANRQLTTKGQEFSFPSPLAQKNYLGDYMVRPDSNTLI
jgi:hypothetical protein